MDIKVVNYKLIKPLKLNYWCIVKYFYQNKYRIKLLVAYNNSNNTTKDKNKYAIDDIIALICLIFNT